MALIGMMAQHSRVWHHARYAGPLFIGLLLIGIGTFFKIGHWPFANAQLLIGSLLAVGIYSLWFKAKGVKSLLSCLKFAFVLSIGVSILTLVFWPAWIELMSGIRKMLFWAMALLFVYQRWVRQPRQLLD